MKTFLPALVALQLFIGCATTYEITAREYLDAASQVHLGSTKADVVRTLEPTQRRLPVADRIQPEMYSAGGVLTEILYFRSRWHDSNASSYDQFTPYVFENDRLVAVGWSGIRRAAFTSMLTGAQAQAQPSLTTVLPPF